MQTKKNVLAYVKALLLIFLAVSCDDSVTELKPEATNEPMKPTPTLEYIRSLGYNDSAIVEYDEYYVVENDIRFSKDIDYVKSATNGRVAQITTPNPVSMIEASDVTVGFYGMATSGPDNWRAEIISAVAAWANIPNNAIRITFVDCPTADCADINVHFNVNASSYLIEGSYPSGNGKPGSVIDLNVSWNNNQTISSSVKTRSFAHALGHTLGLGHTDATSVFSYIPGTACSDASSLMNSTGIGTKTWAGFSQFDVAAVQYLYPVANHQAGTMPFYRYRANFGIGDHFYTWSWAEINCGSGAEYTYEGTEGYIYPSQQPGTTPIYRYFNGSDHFYTTFQTSYSGYSSEGIAGYAYGTNVSGTIPIYRYVGPGNDHFYTKVQTTYPGYTYEFVAWYAYP